MGIFRRLKHRIIRYDERGISLTEAAIAVFLLGGAVLTMVLGMTTGAMSEQKDEMLVTAQGLARTQIEYVKEYAYDADATTYPAVSAPDGYTIDVTVASVPDTGESIQKITADIIFNGDIVFTLHDYKVDR